MISVYLWVKWTAVNNYCTEMRQILANLLEEAPIIGDAAEGGLARVDQTQLICAQLHPLLLPLTQQDLAPRRLRHIRSYQ